MRVASAWIELSTSSEIALAVPLYPESRVAWMNLSSAMIEQVSRRGACAAFLKAPPPGVLDPAMIRPLYIRPMSRHIGAGSESTEKRLRRPLGAGTRLV